MIFFLKKWLSTKPPICTCNHPISPSVHTKQNKKKSLTVSKTEGENSDSSLTGVNYFAFVGGKIHLAVCVSIIRNPGQADCLMDVAKKPPAADLAREIKSTCNLQKHPHLELKCRASNENTILNPSAMLSLRLSPTTPALQQPERCVLMCEHEHDLQEMGSLL